MEYTKKQFFADVKAEANAIKKNATKEEIENLNVSRFDANQKSSCIYGLMTGHCRNIRAVTLIRKCSLKTFKQPQSTESPVQLQLKEIMQNVNGKADAKTIKENELCYYYSAIEAYILLPTAKNENLIRYIKGEKDKLVL